MGVGKDLLELRSDAQRVLFTGEAVLRRLQEGGGGLGKDGEVLTRGSQVAHVEHRGVQVRAKPSLACLRGC